MADEVAPSARWSPGSSRRSRRRGSEARPRMRRSAPARPASAQGRGRRTGTPARTRPDRLIASLRLRITRVRRTERGRPPPGARGGAVRREGQSARCGPARQPPATRQGPWDAGRCGQRVARVGERGEVSRSGSRRGPESGAGPREIDGERGAAGHRLEGGESAIPLPLGAGEGGEDDPEEGVDGPRVGRPDEVGLAEEGQAIVQRDVELGPEDERPVDGETDRPAPPHVSWPCPSATPGPERRLSPVLEGVPPEKGALSDRVEGQGIGVGGCRPIEEAARVAATRTGPGGRRPVARGELVAEDRPAPLVRG